MKKEYILYGVIAILVLWIAVLLFDKFNNSDGDYFKNNLECQKYLEEFRSKYPSSDECSVFYSSKENTCLWVSYLAFWDSSVWYSFSWLIEDIFNADKKHSYYLWEENNWALINSLFKGKRCSDLDDESKNCNLEDYWDLVEEKDKEIEWLKWN